MCTTYGGEVRSRSFELLEQRQQTLGILRAHGADRLWLPRMVDVALSLPRPVSLEKITLSAVFNQRCSQVQMKFAATSVVWTSSLAQDSLRDRKCSLMQSFLDRQVRSVLRRLPSHTGLEDAASEIVRDVFFQSCDRYQVGRIGSNGEAETWGYEAFLTTRIRGFALGHLVRLLRRNRPIDDAGFAKLAAPVAAPIDTTVTSALRFALPVVLPTDWQRRVYREMVYRGESAVNAGRRAGKNAKDVHLRIVVPLLWELRQRLGAPHTSRCYFGPSFRKTCASIICEAEFHSLFERAPAEAR